MLHVNHSHIFSITPLLVWVLLTTALQVQVAAHESATQIHPQFESKTTKAINDWRQNAKINPQADEPIRYLGDALMQRARETGNLSDYQEAKSAFQAALAINPKNSAAMAGMAWVHGSLHEFDASIQWALRAIALDPQNPDAYGLLGDAAVERGDYDAAFELYQKMLDIRPDLASYSRGAHLLFVTGDILAATALMEKAIAAGSPFVENIAWCRAELARMHMSTGALVKAEKLIVHGLESPQTTSICWWPWVGSRPPGRKFQRLSQPMKKQLPSIPITMPRLP